MKTLIVDDNFVARRFLKDALISFGDCDVVTNGNEAVQAFRLAWEDHEPYDLICMDIMMPEMDGHEALQKIRTIEETMGIALTSKEVKVIMISALDDPKNVVGAYAKGGATEYAVKPIGKDTLVEKIKAMGLLACASPP